MDGRIENNIMILENNLTKKFGNYLSKNVKLSNYSWFNLGGNADYLLKAKDKDQLVHFLEEAKKINLKITVIGAGSNTLFRDNGIKGAVIKLGKEFSYTKLINDNILEVGAATLDRNVANFAKDNNIKNLEFLSCIPGSIGGAIIMNSGCYENEISEVLVSIQAIDKKKLSLVDIKKEEINFSYRGTSLSEDLIIISAKLKATAGNKIEIEKKQSDFVKKKKLSQPNQIKTCGSTFKNLSKDRKAWMIIKEAGCENFKEGDAAISQKHCNFFVNKGNAKSSDIENLIQKVKNKVLEKTGVNLELEIKIIGE